MSALAAFGFLILKDMFLIVFDVWQTYHIASLHRVILHITLNKLYHITFSVPLTGPMALPRTLLSLPCQHVYLSKKQSKQAKQATKINKLKKLNK